MTNKHKTNNNKNKQLPKAITTFKATTKAYKNENQ